MQYSLKALVVLAVSGLAAAQIPACAQPCIDAATIAAGCATTDYACACTAANQVTIQNGATSCVIAACGATVALTEVLPAAKALCANPPTASSSTAAAAPPTSSTPAAVSSSAAVSTSTSIAVVVSSSAAPTTTAAPTLATSTLSSNSTSPTSSAVPFTGGAANSAASLGGVFAIGMAVLAAF